SIGERARQQRAQHRAHPTDCQVVTHACRSDRSRRNSPRPTCGRNWVMLGRVGGVRTSICPMEMVTFSERAAPLFRCDVCELCGARAVGAAARAKASMSGRNGMCDGAGSPDFAICRAVVIGGAEVVEWPTCAGDAGRIVGSPELAGALGVS